MVKASDALTTIFQLFSYYHFSDRPLGSSRHSLSPSSSIHMYTKSPNTPQSSPIRNERSINQYRFTIKSILPAWINPVISIHPMFDFRAGPDSAHALFRQSSASAAPEVGSPLRTLSAHDACAPLCTATCAWWVCEVMRWELFGRV